MDDFIHKCAVFLVKYNRDFSKDKEINDFFKYITAEVFFEIENVTEYLSYSNEYRQRKKREITALRDNLTGFAKICNNSTDTILFKKFIKDLNELIK